MGNDKKTILMLCDHPLSTSGVGTQARWLIDGLIKTQKYKFRVFGGAIKHESYQEIVVNDDFIIKPTDGFGNKQLLRQALVQLKPDVLMLFTDPRFFTWVWEMEDEIHQICPIAYWHLWDNLPWPEFNKPLYESTDLINCINYPTYEMVHKRFPNKTNYIPHGVPEELFKPLPQDLVSKFKQQVLGKDREDHFTALFVSRNARRKMPSDILISWKMFIDEIKEKYGHTKATLVMHTDPLDHEGPNLHHVINLLQLQNNVCFSKDRINFQEMVGLYNMCDVLVNRSCAEGFGLGLLEAKMCGKPVIALKTGGMTRQVEDHVTGKQYGVAIDVETKSLVGNQQVPFIFEDYVTHETVAKAFLKMFEMPKEQRLQLGDDCLRHAKENYDLKNVIKQWDISLSLLLNNWRSTNNNWECVEI